MFAYVSNKNLIRQCYMWFSISNKSSWAHKINYPIDMPVNISWYAGINSPLHPLKAKDLMKDKLIKIDTKEYMRGEAYQSKAHEHVNSIISLELVANGIL